MRHLWDEIYQISIWMMKYKVPSLVEPIAEYCSLNVLGTELGKKSYTSPVPIAPKEQTWYLTALPETTHVEEGRGRLISSSCKHKVGAFA